MDAKTYLKLPIHLLGLFIFRLLNRRSGIDRKRVNLLRGNNEIFKKDAVPNPCPFTKLYTHFHYKIKTTRVQVDEQLRFLQPTREHSFIMENTTLKLPYPYLMLKN